MIAVDANIIQELLESRRKVAEVVRTLAGYTENGENLSLSTLTVSHVFYLSEVHKIPISRVEGLIAQYRLYDVAAEDVAWALMHYQGKDFEDALQVAAALREKCSVFLTLDTALAKKYGKFLTVELV